MKMRMIKLTPEFLIAAMQGKASFISNLPADLELLDLKYDLFSKQVLAIVRSDRFEDIAETYPIPEFNVVYAASSKAASQPAAKPEVESKPVEKTRVAPSLDTSAVEEEFSPEQRELLSFTMDGDCVIVKPVQYLKDEWNEINDVVRSLGGRWVKGDFSSYWVVPPS
jgi:hypothetical protein